MRFREKCDSDTAAKIRETEDEAPVKLLRARWGGGTYPHRNFYLLQKSISTCLMFTSWLAGDKSPLQWLAYISSRIVNNDYLGWEAGYVQKQWRCKNGKYVFEVKRINILMKKRLLAALNLPKKDRV